MSNDITVEIRVVQPIIVTFDSMELLDRWGPPVRITDDVLLALKTAARLRGLSLGEIQLRDVQQVYNYATDQWSFIALLLTYPEP